jgi:hypothetical protein
MNLHLEKNTPTILIEIPHKINANLKNLHFFFLIFSISFYYIPIFLKKVIVAIKIATIAYKSYFEYCQIWLSMPMGDYHLINITKLKNKIISLIFSLKFNEKCIHKNLF